jgi:gamma-glutamyltranspeptidase/glutathione hydrolase
MLRAEHGATGPVDLIALGAAGSRRTTSAILHTVSGLVDRGLSLAAAVDAPRFHVRLSRRAWLETAPETEPLRVQLAQQFRKIDMCSRHSYKMGCVQAIQVGPRGMMSGAADPRREGTVHVVLDQSDTKNPG